MKMVTHTIWLVIATVEYIFIHFAAGKEQLFSNQPNVCQKTVSFLEPFTEAYVESFRAKTLTTCFAIPPRCTKYVTKSRTLYRIAHRVATRDHYDCCPGFSLKSGNCEPSCEAGCVHGMCIGPDVCQCQSGWRGRDCNSACPAGTWGAECAFECVCRHGAVCDVLTGACDCTAGYYGPACQFTCPPGRYGAHCQQTCHCVQGQGSCDPFTGRCNCGRGFKGPLCAEKCPDDFYGEKCQSKCQCQNNGSCDPADGSCDCPSGWMGDVCALACPPDTFGINCSHNCLCYNDATCLPTTGECNCSAGFTGLRCEKGCPFQLYGKNCSQSCDCENDMGCDHVSGRCICMQGFYGNRCQFKECTQPGRYGPSCINVCSCAINQSQCDSRDGSCRCFPGFLGETCAQECPADTFGANCSQTCECNSNKQRCDHVEGCVDLAVIVNSGIGHAPGGLSTGTSISLAVVCLLVLLVILLIIVCYYRYRYKKVKRTNQMMVRYSTVSRHENQPDPCLGAAGTSFGPDDDADFADAISKNPLAALHRTPGATHYVETPPPYTPTDLAGAVGGYAGVPPPYSETEEESVAEGVRRGLSRRGRASTQQMNSSRGGEGVGEASEEQQAEGVENVENDLRSETKHAI